MSALGHRKRATTLGSPSDSSRILYEEDFFGWTQDQARLLRDRQLEKLDIVNLLDEVESLGRSVKREIGSRFTVLLVHLLKWQYQPERRSRSWKLTIAEQRREIARELEDSPSLRSFPADCLANEYDFIRVRASVETDLNEDVFPPSCPYSVNEILDPDFLPGRE